jgi:hypothetical protein
MIETTNNGRRPVLTDQAATVATAVGTRHAVLLRKTN